MEGGRETAHTNMENTKYVVYQVIARPQGSDRFLISSAAESVTRDVFEIEKSQADAFGLANYPISDERHCFVVGNRLVKNLLDLDHQNGIYFVNAYLTDSYLICAFCNKYPYSALYGYYDSERLVGRITIAETTLDIMGNEVLLQFRITIPAGLNSRGYLDMIFHGLPMPNKTTYTHSRALLGFSEIVDYYERKDLFLVNRFVELIEKIASEAVFEIVQELQKIKDLRHIPVNLKLLERSMKKRFEDRLS